MNVAKQAISRYRSRPWDLVLPVAFSLYTGWILFVALVAPIGVGSHALIYTDAAAAWLAGQDPWSVGPPRAVFAGPPPMLLPFVPFISLHHLAIRLIWVAGMAFVAAWVIRRLRLPVYWMAFPPLVEAVVLGHVEVLVLGLLVIPGVLSGFAVVIKPYAIFALIGERRWAAIGVAFVTIAATAPLLPWALFIERFGEISETLSRQANGDSTFGYPIYMCLAVAGLLAIGRRRGLWLIVPLLWPNAQFLYKTISVPALSPLVALAWALPLPGATLVGVLAEAGVRLAARRYLMPAWLLAGVAPAARPLPATSREESSI